MQERSLEAFALQCAPVLKAADMTDDVARAAKGDVSAFERVYHAHLPRVHSLVRRMAGGRDTDELTQDVFVRGAEAQQLPWRCGVLDMAPPARRQRRHRTIQDGHGSPSAPA